MFALRISGAPEVSRLFPPNLHFWIIITYITLKFDSSNTIMRRDRPDVEWRVAGRPAEGEAAWGESHDWERSMHLWDATAHAAGMSLKDPNYRLS